MKWIELVTGAALAASLVPLHAQTPPPQFQDYPAKGVYRGTNAPVVLLRADKEYRTRLQDAARQAPNLGGHFILKAWGCGAQCLMGAVIDANSGRVYWLPHTICCWNSVNDNFQPIEFRLDSRLIVFRGLRNEKEGDQGVHFYEFDDGKFTEIQSIRKK